MRRFAKKTAQKRDRAKEKQDKDSSVGGWDIKLPTYEIKNKCIGQNWFFLMTICCFCSMN